eukprot:comp4814_c0_seq1/m.938 comp4814_c0_seq1/g.938  ORF comp4814_c0_seq1/g.938 comp4814_c0_seq1/m.938 type:complete len:492 (-) comp4814_c0_seq1:673-2148(-)
MAFPIHLLNLFSFLFLSCLASNFLAFGPDPHSYFPKVSVFQPSLEKAQENASAKGVNGSAVSKPVLPQTIYKAWQVGVLYGRVMAAKDEERDTILSQATQLLGAPHLLTARDLKSIEISLKKLEGEDEENGEETTGKPGKSHSHSRIAGLFSFANIVWVIATIGIAVSILPAISQIARPFLDSAHRFVLHFIVPVAFWLHTQRALEFLLYVVCVFLIGSGNVVPKTHNYGVLITFSGLILLIPAFFYTCANVGVFVQIDKDSPGNIPAGTTFVLSVGKFRVFSATLYSLCVFAQAVYHQSILLGYLCVVTIYFGLGFFIVNFGLCWVTGFDGHNSMVVSAGTSLFLLCFFGCVKAMSINHRILLPFESAVGVFGSTMYFLSFLIMSSKFYYYDVFDGQPSSYIIRNIVMVISLFSAMFFGSVLGMDGMCNTAITFFALYAMEKIGEIASRRGVWVLVLASSLFLYYISLVVNRNPKYVSSLFSSPFETSMV